MRLRPILLFFVFPLSFFYGQEKGGIQSLLKNAEQAVYNNPGQAIQISEYVLSAKTGFHEKSRASFLLANSLYVKGEYPRALQKILELKQNPKAFGTPHSKIELLAFSTHLFQLFGLEVLAEQNFEKINVILSKEKNNPLQNRAKAIRHHYRGLEFLEQGNNESALQQLYKAKYYASRNNKKYNWASRIPVTVAKVHLKERRLDSAFFYLENILSKPQNRYLKMLALSGMGDVYFFQKENQKAVPFFEKALKTAKEFENLSMQKTITEKIASNYLALRNRQAFFAQTQQTISLTKQLENQEDKVLSIAYNFVDKMQEQHYTTVKNKNVETTYILGGILTGIVLIGFLAIVRTRSREKQYAGLLSYLENPPKKRLKKQVPGKSVVIPKETEENLLTKLEGFEQKNRFTEKELSLAKLAAQFETNTKYLSEVINHHKDKNFNSYINELRIGYITEKLKHAPHYSNYKVSYLAKECGFSSHSSFATVFKSITGVPPMVFIGLLHKAKKRPT